MCHAAPPVRLTGVFLRWLAAALLLGAGAAQASPAALCDAAARAAARETGVPLAVLRAIALTETGRQRGGSVEPWPWATNAAGEGHWFDTRAEAQAHVRALRARGIDSIDIGCMQVNLRWHGAAFAGPDAMFDPDANALYAARFLAGLHEEFGSWEGAAGAYHSRTPELAARYTQRFRSHLAQLGDDPGPARQRRGRAPVQPGGPLLQAAVGPLFTAASPAVPGSLLTEGASRGGSLFSTSAGALR